MIENIWEGVYSDFTEIPRSGSGFRGDDWITNSEEKIQITLRGANEQSTIPHRSIQQSSILPVVASMASVNATTLKILDWGGGLGFSFVPVVDAIPEIEAIEYHIVELQRVCEAGNRLFQDDSRINFHSTLPNSLSTVDIVHLGTSLQYVDDWRSLLASLASYQPKYFVFDDLQAGDIPTYATSQKYYGSNIPCWFFNIKEILEAMSEIGYKLIFKSAFLATVLGNRQPLPQPNFPEEYRLGHACNLLFHPIPAGN